MDKLKLRCPCTMQEMGEGRHIKPYGGYFDPDPKCIFCKGKGYKEAKVSYDDAEKVFVGICPICGEHNGVYFLYPHDKIGPDRNGKPHCINDECPNEYCEWVESNDSIS